MSTKPCLQGDNDSHGSASSPWEICSVHTPGPESILEITSYKLQKKKGLMDTLCLTMLVFRSHGLFLLCFSKQNFQAHKNNYFFSLQI